MQIIIDTVDGECYADVIMSSNELDRMRFGEMIDGIGMYRHRRCYVGVRLRNIYEEAFYEEDEWEE
jgi:hypothetical protein